MTPKPTNVYPGRPRAVAVVGASAGGVEALRALTAGLPAGLDTAVLVVLHLPPNTTSALPGILDRCGTLPAAPARDRERIRPGRVYVAPPDHHLLVTDGRVRLSRGPTENGHRPAVDPLFRSAARVYGPRTIGVVLSGARDDGTSGLASVVGRGGSALVQDPVEALHASMPRSALEHVPKSVALSVVEMGGVIAELTSTMPAWPDPDPADDPVLVMETAVAEMEQVATDEIGVSSGLACPDCHGVLFELPGEPAPRYRCRVGHAWSPESLLDEQAAGLESALWVAVRSLEEKAALAKRMASAARERGSTYSALRYDEIGAEAQQAAPVVRRLVERLGGVIEEVEHGRHDR